MTLHPIRNSLAALAVLCATTLGPTVQAAPTVLKGSDYLQTTEGTTFLGVPFMGVPVGPGNTDTVVSRLADAMFSGVGTSETVPIELVSLNLVSVMPIDIGGGFGLHYVTLQSMRGGPASQGRMTIHYDTADDSMPNTPEGTFDSFFDVFFDIRLGALDGPILGSDMLRLTSQGTAWDADPPDDALIVPGLVGDGAANLHTDRNTDQMDLFPLGTIIEQHPSGAIHRVRLAVPAPPALSLVILALIAAGLGGRRYRCV